MFIREKLVELIKASGQEIIDRAEDFVGDGDMISDFDIHIYFDNRVPEIEINRSHISRTTLRVMR